MNLIEQNTGRLWMRVLDDHDTITSLGNFSDAGSCELVFEEEIAINILGHLENKHLT